MDLTESIAPRSDQLNADDLMAGPVTVTVAEVVPGAAEQPVDVRLVEFPGRAYRPSKSMRRVMVAAWGKEASEYAGRRITLFRNPEITFGRDKVGGIEISHLSDLDKPLTVALTATRGKRKAFTVQPLPKPAPRDWDLEIDSRVGNETALRALYNEAQKAGEHPHLLERIRAAAMAPAAPTEAWRDRDWEAAIHDERDNLDFLKKLHKEALNTKAPKEILDQLVAACKRAEAVA